MKLKGHIYARNTAIACLIVGLVALYVLLNGCGAILDDAHDVDVSAAIYSCDTFFNRIDGTQGDEIISIDYGSIEFVLWGSEFARNTEYRRRHKRRCPGYGVCLVRDGKFKRSKTEVWTPFKRSKTEVWVPFKRLANGQEIIHPWVLQHEIHHAIDLALLLMGRPDAMSDPDEYARPGFFRTVKK